MTDSPIRRPGVIAVLGGTFDPPHWGHVRAAEAVRDRMGVDAVWLVPASIPPHRPEPPRLSARERFRLVEEAVSDRDRLLASPIELERDGPSFTIDTLDALAAERPPASGGEPSLIFVVGSDAFCEIRTWSRYEELLGRHPVLVHRRSGCPIGDAVAVLPAHLRARVTDDLSVPLMPPRIFTMDISLPDPESHRIRELLRARVPVDGLLPSRVASRIAEQGLYR